MQDNTNNNCDWGSLCETGVGGHWGKHKVFVNLFLTTLLNCSVAGINLNNKWSVARSARRHTCVEENEVSEWSTTTTKKSVPKTNLKAAATILLWQWWQLVIILERGQRLPACVVLGRETLRCGARFFCCPGLKETVHITALFLRNKHSVFNLFTPHW